MPGENHHGVRGLIHLGLYVSDLDRAIALWSEAFGFELTAGPFEPPAEMVARVVGVDGAVARGAMLTGGGIEVELSESSTGESAAGHAAVDPGISHLALEVGDLDATLSAAERHGARRVGEIAEFEVDRGTGRLVYLRDPDGAVIELIELDATAQ